MQIELSHRSQRGTALVFALLILLIMTVLGVAALSNSQMQERMAGNASLQSQAFEASSAGISDALHFGMNQFFGDPDDGSDDPDGEAKCTTDTVQAGDWDTPKFGDVTTLELEAGSSQTAGIEFQLRAECFQDPGLDPDVAPAEGYVTSASRVTMGTETLSSREVEVRVARFRSDGRSALRIEGGDESEVTVSFDAPNSNKLFVDGKDGPAISTSTQQNADEVQSSIKERRLANYDGGIVKSQYDAPFNSAREMVRFALEVKAFMEYHGIDDEPGNTATATSPDQCDANELDLANAEYDFPDSDKGLEALVLPELRFFDGNASSKTEFNGITYVAGDLSLGGNASGRGIVIVEGDVSWHGTADFQGLVIGLGGRFDIDGAGSGTTDGSVYVANINLASMNTAYDNLVMTGTWDDVVDQIYGWGDTEFAGLDTTTFPGGFGDTNVDLNGGGSHTFTYDCNLLDQQRMTLGACGKTSTEDDFPDPNDAENEAGKTPPGLAKKSVFDGLADPWWSQLCNTPGEGGTTQAIRSWRENLGWRELVDDGA